ncbi:MAG: hypothetical protein IJS54_00235 [Desulfovibrio sp.]|nr:hypothetical protein [Desulfovibrio sp.]
MKSLRDFSFHAIDWDLSPEDAVTLYLEWGNNSWDHRHPPVCSKSDSSLYFVVDSWQDPPVIRLVLRTMEKAEDVCVVPVPEHLLPFHRNVHGTWRGICEPVPEIKAWLKEEMDKD